MLNVENLENTKRQRFCFNHKLITRYHIIQRKTIGQSPNISLSMHVFFSSLHFMAFYLYKMFFYLQYIFMLRNILGAF